MVLQRSIAMILFLFFRVVCWYLPKSFTGFLRRYFTLSRETRLANIAEYQMLPSELKAIPPGPAVAPSFLSPPRAACASIRASEAVSAGPISPVAVAVGTENSKISLVVGLSRAI